jgi:hypothetical protein
MGRTLPTQVQILRNAEEEWKSFRRALRKEDQEAFDILWSYARRHAVPASMAARPLPFDAHVLSMLVGLQHTLSDIEKQIRGKKIIEASVSSSA